MSNDNSNNGPPNDRRGSVTSAAFSNLFHRSNSTSAGSSTGNGRESATVAAAREQRRRLSVTTLGLSGTSPSTSASTPFGIRRGSISTTTSESIDESAVEDDESAKGAPAAPFTRRISFGAQAMRNMRPGSNSPGSTGRPAQPPRRISGSDSRPQPTGASSTSSAAGRTSTPQASNTPSARTPSDMISARSDNGYNWSEQLRSRAESSVSGHRPHFGAGASVSPTRHNPQHDRAKSVSSVSDMPGPPQQAVAMKPRQPERPKPDYMQERILKGDFYMD